ncbi:MULTISPECIES: ribonuclease J [Sporomusa]|uniref:Ribonuclease J n=2 Tax=Sporomusa TaxID=2375 RepID=A0ABP2C809_9FIRM|nr:ribonuclease J [Sporomusa sphaeroides]OLS57032.1 ribonuclease J 1 [Sporomusa sphaeroides DSM 2875]CVK18218.1 Ribonuclease J 1 [Sporomusa sphaeroides DSM 2875]SCM81679.1 Ribonuclease J 1 [uncultured Sporomusa sp.]
MNKNEKLLIIPLGGLGEIGKNMTVFRYGDDIIIVDSGLAFPEEDMLGIDLVIPDMSYLFDNKDKIKAVVLTHGHEDHIGSLFYLLRQVDVPVYGSRLTLGLVEGRLKEYAVSDRNLIPVGPGDAITLGQFEVGFIRVNHSIADALAVYLKTPLGTVVHTGDFKLDQTPVDGQIIDIHKFAELGNQGVLVLLSDSTNAEREGYTKSERTVSEALDEHFSSAKGRIILTTFASNVSRLQQAINSACEYGRKVALLGRSMVTVITKATELGYMTIPEGVLIGVDEIGRYPENQILILTTGSQGEPMAALSRLASRSHRSLELAPGDTVLIAANPIPGNERSVGRTIDALLRLGIHVVYERSSGIHVSGHGSQEELKLILNLVRPKFLIPVHGEHRMLKQHGKLATEIGIPKENVFIGENGHVFEFTAETGRFAGKVTAGKIFVDGLGVGDVGNIVIRDRRQLSKDGVLIVVVTLDKARGCILDGPDIVSRGFVYVRDSDALIDESRKIVKSVLERFENQPITEWAPLKAGIREALGKYLFAKTGRRPMILPIIMDL